MEHCDAKRIPLEKAQIGRTDTYEMLAYIVALGSTEHTGHHH